MGACTGVNFSWDELVLTNIHILRDMIHACRASKQSLHVSSVPGPHQSLLPLTHRRPFVRGNHCITNTAFSSDIDFHRPAEFQTGIFKVKNEKASASLCRYIKPQNNIATKRQTWSHQLSRHERDLHQTHYAVVESSDYQCSSWSVKSD